MAKLTDMLKGGMDFLSQNEEKISSALSQAKSLAEKNLGKGRTTEAIGKIEDGLERLKSNRGNVESAMGLISAPKSANIASMAGLAKSIVATNMPAEKTKPAEKAAPVAALIETPAEAAKETAEVLPVATTGGKEIEIEVVDPEDDYFESTLQRLDEAASKEAMTNPQAAMQALTTLAECAQETVRYCAEQETKREEIRAMRDHAIAKVNAVTEILKDYLDKTFDERSMIFAEQFKSLDQAMSTGNTEALGMVLNSINALAAQSPFKALADINQVQQNLTDGAEWDI